MYNSTPNERAKSQLTLKEKVGQLFMPAAFINDTEEEIQHLEKLVQEQHVGGLCFFHSRASAATNFEGKKKVVHHENSLDTLRTLITRYQKASKYPLLMAIDAEWGLSMRIENTPQYPYAICLGAIQEGNDLIYEVGKQIANDCKAVGLHWNLAPVVDLNNNPNNPVIGYRSFGEDKHQVTEKAMAFIKGMQSQGILTSIKHFPGHGDTDTDSHLALPMISKPKEELQKNELYPFQRLIDEGVDSVMVGHLSVPGLSNGKTTSSSLSKEVITEVLRKEMGYQGVVISDALNMHAVSKNHPTKGELEWLAFDAGNDILCFTEHVAEGIETILSNAPKTQIEESFRRIWTLKEKAFSSKTIDRIPGTNHNLLRHLAQKSLTLYQGTDKAIAELSSQRFVVAENDHSFENHFFKHIATYGKSTLVTADLDMEVAENLLLALYPKQVKPAHNFGFSDEEITTINHLLTSKNVVLYLFGNPYALNLFDISKARAVVVAFQNFPEFQETAASHFLGKIEAVGRLPVSL